MDSQDVESARDVSLGRIISKPCLQGCIKEKMETQNNKLFVGNLPFSIDDAKLAALVTDADANLKVVEAKVIIDRFTNRSKGFGFITLETDEMAQAAIALINGKEIDGRQIAANIARPMEKRDNNDRGSFRRSF